MLPSRPSKAIGLSMLVLTLLAASNPSALAEKKSARNPFVSELNVEVGDRQVVMPDKYHDLRFFPDEPIGIISRNPLIFTMTGGWGGSDGTFLMKGTTLETAIPFARVLQPTRVDGDFDSDYAGISSLHIDPRRREILGFYHAERHRKGTVSYTGGAKWYGTVALVTSKDDGKTFVRQGPIITGSVPFNPKSGHTSQGVGDPSVCVDHTNQYLYCYYTDHTRVNGRSVIICMARSKIEDGGRPGTWKKYHEGSFCTDGLGGQDTQVANVYGPNVTYISSIKKYIMVGNREGIEWCYSDDGIHWSKIHELVRDGHSVPLPDKPTAMRAHLMILRSDSTSASGYLLYTYSPRWGGSESQTPHFFVKRSVKFGLARTAHLANSDAHSSDLKMALSSESLGGLPRPLIDLTFEGDLPQSIDNHGAKSVVGKVGSGLEFDGKSYVKVSGEFPSGSSPRTLAAWLKNTRGPVNRNVHVITYGPISKGRPFGVMEAGRNWRFFDFDGGLGSGVEVDKQWHHHCLTYDGKAITYFVDAKPVATVARTLTTSQKPLVLGTSPSLNENYAYEGLIDELVIYDKPLSSEQVRQLLECGQRGKHP